MAKKVKSKNQLSEKEYRQLVAKKLEALKPVFARASMGDFSRNITLPKKNDEFAGLYASLQMMIEIVREKLAMMEEVNQSLEKKIRSHKLKENDELFVGVSGVLIKININEILFIKAVSDYVIIHTTLQKYMAHSTMKGLLKRLPERDFMRIHHSFIVRLDKITEKHAREVIVGGTKIPVSWANRKKLSEKLRSY